LHDEGARAGGGPQWCMVRKSSAAALGGALLALAAVAAFDAVRYHHAAPAPSAQALSRPLGEFQVDPSWVLSGKPVFKGVETLRSPDGRVVSGLWACEGPTTFEWQFSHDETVHLLEGHVEVEYLGRRFSIRPGDTATFHAGTRAVWHVREYAKKAYTLHQPHWLVRAWRKVTGLHE
jgi:uncharacterized protein